MGGVDDKGRKKACATRETRVASTGHSRPAGQNLTPFTSPVRPRPQPAILLCSQSQSLLNGLQRTVASLSHSHDRITLFKALRPDTRQILQSAREEDVLERCDCSMLTRSLDPLSTSIYEDVGADNPETSSASYHPRPTCANVRRRFCTASAADLFPRKVPRRPREGAMNPSMRRNINMLRATSPTGLARVVQMCCSFQRQLSAETWREKPSVVI